MENHASSAWELEAPLLGLSIAGCGEGAPEQLPGTPGSLDEGAALERLLGADWRAELARRGHDTDHVARRHGVQRRSWCRVPGSSDPPAADALDLAERAAREALDEARWSARELDLLLVASSTPSELSASLAARLADRLGAGGAPLDLRAGGAGGLLALVSAAALLHGGGRRALVVAAEATSLYLPSEPLSTALLYGDGAAALALERRPGESGGLLRAASARVAPAGQSFTVAPAAHGPGASGLRFRAPDRAYGARLGRAVDELAERLRREPPPQHFLPAVAGDLPLARLHSLTGLPMDRTHTVHRSHGVLGAAAPLLAWVRLHRSGAVRPGDELLLAAVGGGIQWALVRWRLAAGDELEVVR